MTYLSHEFIRDFTGLRYYDSIRPGKRTGDPLVTDIRVLKYLPSGRMQYKLNFDDNYEDLCKPRKAEIPSEKDVVPSLCKGSIPIKKSKYYNLQQLKHYTPRDHHAFMTIWYIELVSCKFTYND